MVPVIAHAEDVAACVEDALVDTDFVAAHIAPATACIAPVTIHIEVASAHVEATIDYTEDATSQT